MAENKDNKVIGILSYLGILWIIAYIMYGDNKTKYNAFHVKEGLGLFISLFGLIIIVNILQVIKLGFVAWILSFVGYPVLLVFCILGIINAVNGEMKPIPIISEYITQRFLQNFR